jgi:hypothetical protein
MAIVVFANQPTTTVSTGGTSAPAALTSEQWTVASSTTFPAVSATALPSTYFLVADTAATSEIIAVTAITSTVWGVTRGFEGTTPVTHSGGFTVMQVVSAGTLQNFKQASNAQTSTVTVSNSSTETVVASYTPFPGEVEAGATFEIAASGTFGATTNAIPTLQWTIYSGGSGAPGASFTATGSSVLCQMVTGSTTTSTLCPPLGTTTATTTTAATTGPPGQFISIARLSAGTSFDVNGTVEWISTTSAIGNLNFFWTLRGLNATTFPTYGFTGVVSSAAAVTGLTSTNPIIITVKWNTASAANALTAPAPLVFRGA